MRTLARHLFTVHGHHRIEIDPAADNARRHPRLHEGGVPAGRDHPPLRAGADGTWHDGLLMDLLAEELAAEPDDEVLDRS